MYLEDFAKQVGKSYQTVYFWYKEGRIPGAYQLVRRGKIIVPDDAYETMVNNSITRASLSKEETVNKFLDEVSESYSKYFGRGISQEELENVLSALNLQLE